MAKGKPRYSKIRAIAEESDPEWKAWFERLERLRKEAARARSHAVFSWVEKADTPVAIVRKKTEPVRINKVLKKGEKREGRVLDFDRTCIEQAWRSVAGMDVSSESAVYAFKNGVLTISVFSPTLLQEIRQFHQEAILRDLRDIWRATVPLVRLVFRPGKK